MFLRALHQDKLQIVLEGDLKRACGSWGVVHGFSLVITLLSWLEEASGS